jgi:ABC-type multidrug transport system ATPase subunit
MHHPLASVEVENVTFRYGVNVVLRGLSARFVAGGIHVIEGANGCGKSTLLRVLSTEIQPHHGRVHMRHAGGGTLTAQQARQSVGIVQHDAMVYPDLTGLENLQLFATLYGVADHTRTWARSLQPLQLEPFWHRPARTYSRGQLQRLALARAFLHSPSLVLLDEPTTGLDERSTAVLDDMLRQAQARGAVVVVTSHDTGLAQRLGATRMRVERGKVLA